MSVRAPARLAPLQTEEKNEESFGPGFQNLIVTAPEFAGRVASGAPLLSYSGLGYYHSAGTVFPTRYFAPLHLPSGAVVIYIQCFVRDTSVANDVFLTFQEQTFDFSSGDPNLTFVDSWSSGGSGGYQVPVSNGNLNYTIRLNEGSIRRTYYLSADLASDTALQACRVNWQRTVSPAPVSPTFGDVPTNYIYFRAIEALAAAGITSGCPNGNFCPGPFVREDLETGSRDGAGFRRPLPCSDSGRRNGTRPNRQESCFASPPATNSRSAPGPSSLAL